MNFEVAMEIQRISTGETRPLTRGQIAEDVIDIDKTVKGLNKEKTEKCMEFYNSLINDDTAKDYDIDLLMEEREAIRKEMDEFVRTSIRNDGFSRITDAIEEFFIAPPFEGLDGVEYGVNEICVFSVLEHFIAKKETSHDSEGCRKEYYEDLCKRTSEPVADYWIGVYDDLQKRYNRIADADAELRAEITACAIIAVAAIGNHDSFSLDLVEAGAAEKGKSVIDAMDKGEYTEGESVLTDNAIKLMEFIYKSI